MAGRTIELLAPAGGIETLYAAYAAGADAVYIGGSRFGARAYADNAQEQELIRAIEYAKLHGKKLYLTVNTLLKEKELEGELYAYLKPFAEAGLDAVIVQDFGVMRRIREDFPGLHIHASTQMTAAGELSAARLVRAGVKRVVLPRELSLQEIQAIKKAADIEVECFIHGALCYCYSGQCLFSSIAGGRSGNRGRCAQPCRLAYSVDDGEKEILPAARGYILSPKDLCTIDILPQLVSCGIDSLKIEGRMKKPEYTAGVVSIYRKYLDRFLSDPSGGYTVSEDDRRKLAALFSRKGFTEGYYRQHNSREMITYTEPDFRREDEELTAQIRDSYIGVKLKEKVKGTVRIFAGEPAILKLTEEKTGITAEAAGEIVQKANSRPLDEESIRRQTDRIKDTDFVFSSLKVETDGASFFPVGSLNELRRSAVEQLREHILSARRPEAAAQALPTAEEPSEKLTPAGAAQSAGQYTGAVGLPSQDAGVVGQPCWDAVTAQDTVTAAQSAAQSSRDAAQPSSEGGCRPWTIRVETRAQLEAALQADFASTICLDCHTAEPQEYADLVRRVHESGKTCSIALPGVFRQENMAWYRKYEGFLASAGFDSALAGSAEALLFAGLLWPGRVRSDAGLYAWNKAAVAELKQWGARGFTLPVELNERELRDLDSPEAEMIVYGRLPMMISAQCIRRNTLGCKKGGGLLYLTDRLGNRFPVKNYCRECMNVIYNCLPLLLMPGREKGLSGFKGSFRISFTTEDRKETERVLGLYRELLSGGAPARPEGVTRGHLRRGVE